MGALFGKSKKPQSRITDQDRVVLQLKTQRDRLKQYQKRIELNLEKDREEAKKCLQKGRKERAKLLLRKKKYQEKLLENTDVQLENLEKLAADIEFAQIEADIVNKLKMGNEALKAANELMNIEEIENIMDETREGAEKQKEIDTILSGTLTDQDEEDVLAELDDLVNADEAEKQANTNIQLPEVPTDEPEPVADDDEKVADEEPEKVKEKPKRILVEA
ncbi:charged multivesicular body protein 6-A [Episyrphus balteatus]|uniref:charged multivesicular body protein 6-A n=1 Tax=Episyrphus balteatus TaxID=286459 RepID=UPI002485F954|nr:charged multivesicular body protein 6-A [Episyrphus balteatus]